MRRPRLTRHARAPAAAAAARSWAAWPAIAADEAGGALLLGADPAPSRGLRGGAELACASEPRWGLHAPSMARSAASTTAAHGNVPGSSRAPSGSSVSCERHRIAHSTKQAYTRLRRSRGPPSASRPRGQGARSVAHLNVCMLSHQKQRLCGRKHGATTQHVSARSSSVHWRPAARRLAACGCESSA